WGASSVGNSANTATMQTTATSATNLTGVAATASRLCQCATNAGAFSSTTPTANDCTSAEATACPSGHRVITVTVTTTKTFTTIFTSILPATARTVNLTRTASLRVIP